MKEENFLLELANQIKIARKRSGKTLMEVLHDSLILPNGTERAKQ